MTNPFDAATPALIECYEANVAHYRSGEAKPNYPMPAIRYGIHIDVDYVCVFNRTKGITEKVFDLGYLEPVIIK